MPYFNFKRLIDKYSTDLTLIVPNNVSGYDDSGDKLKTNVPTTVSIRGALISHREIKILRSEGTLTQQDKILFVFSPITEAFQNAKVTDNIKVYSIGDLLENAEFTGVYAYSCKYVSIFSEVSGE